MIRKMKESTEKIKLRVKDIIRKLKREIPEAKTALRHQNPLELLVATILSAQCTDERVNKVTPILFKKYRSVQDFANANVSDFENEIKSTGFYHAKTKSIVNCCKSLIDNYGGKIPETIEELVKLPGVGRKTANVVLGNAFGITSGIVVDTHVKRLSERLGLTKHTDPEKVEIDLMKIVNKKDWIIFGDLLVLHGRRVCNARKPKCLECPISQMCPSAEKFMVMN
jgi:endonuclease III